MGVVRHLDHRRRHSRGAGKCRYRRRGRRRRGRREIARHRQRAIRDVVPDGIVAVDGHVRAAADAHEIPPRHRRFVNVVVIVRASSAGEGDTYTIDIVGVIGRIRIIAIAVHRIDHRRIRTEISRGDIVLDGIVVEFVRHHESERVRRMPIEDDQRPRGRIRRDHNERDRRRSVRRHERERGRERWRRRRRRREDGFRIGRAGGICVAGVPIGFDDRRTIDGRRRAMRLRRMLVVISVGDRERGPAHAGEFGHRDDEGWGREGEGGDRPVEGRRMRTRRRRVRSEDEVRRGAAIERTTTVSVRIAHADVIGVVAITVDTHVHGRRIPIIREGGVGIETEGIRESRR